MTHHTRVSTSAAVLAVLFLAASVAADSWRMPARTKYYSANRQFRLEVEPRELESQLKYFSDKVNGQEPAGAPAGTPMRGPRATLSRRHFLGYRQLSSFQLVNEVAPVDVLITDDGKHVVTFDNWHQVGYGDSVVVIYRSSGDVVGRFGLTDLMAESDIEHLPHSVSSIQWRDKYSVDLARRDLIVEVSSADRELPAQWKRTFEIRIDLAAGRLREPVSRLWPQLVPDVEVVPAGDSESGTVSEGTPCSSSPPIADTSRIAEWSSGRLLETAVSRPLPAYPPIAQVARVRGTVVVEVLVDGGGSVQCARALSGPPLLSYAAVDAARRWSFGQLSSPSEPVIGRIAFRFAAQWK